MQDELVTDSGLKFYIDPTYRKEWQSSVTAVVAALPLKASKEDRKILSQIKVGDEVAISYRVVADFHYQGDGDRFMEASEGSPYMKLYCNGKGERIEVMAMSRPGSGKVTWVGMYLNKYSDLVNGAQGTESEVERWQSQFKFGKTDLYTFNNLISFEGKDYWKCDPSDIYAVRRKGKLISVGNRVIGKPIDEIIPAHILQHIQHPGDVKVRYQDRFVAITGGEDKQIKKDDIVAVAPNYLEKYEFFGAQYYLVSQQLIHGKWSKN